MEMHKAQYTYGMVAASGSEVYIYIVKRAEPNVDHRLLYKKHVKLRNVTKRGGQSGNMIHRPGKE